MLGQRVSTEKSFHPNQSIGVYARWCFLILGLLLFLASQPVAAVDIKKRGWFLDFNAYPYMSDTKNDNYLTINAGAKLGDGLPYFSLNNFGKIKGVKGAPGTATFYAEHHLRWSIARSLPLDLARQMNFRTGPKNDRYWLGMRWRLNDTIGLTEFFEALNLNYSVTLYPAQLGHKTSYVWQIEHAFSMKLPMLSDRLYLAGFVDHNFSESLPDNFSKNPIVGEAQVGFRWFDQAFAVAEYRVNEYRRAEVDNLALGLQSKIIW